MPADKQKGPDGPQRSKIMHIRIDDALFAAAMKKARRYGGMSPVIRALLRRFVTEATPSFSFEDLEEENTPAPRPGRPRLKQP